MTESRLAEQRKTIYVCWGYRLSDAHFAPLTAFAYVGSWSLAVCCHTVLCLRQLTIRQCKADDP